MDRWILTLFLFLGFTGPIQASIDIRTNIQDVYYRSTCAEAGAITMSVGADEFAMASEATPVYIRIQLRNAAKLCMTLVGPGDTGLTSRIYLAMRLEDGNPSNTINAPDNSVNIERWRRGESSIWLRVQSSSSEWIHSVTGQMVPPSLSNGRIAWTVGMTARASFVMNEDRFRAQRANRPANMRDDHPVSTLIAVDFSSSQLSNIWDSLSGDDESIQKVNVFAYQNVSGSEPTVFAAATEGMIALPSTLDLTFRGDDAIGRGYYFEKPKTAACFEPVATLSCSGVTPSPGDFVYIENTLELHTRVAHDAAVGWFGNEQFISDAGWMNQAGVWLEKANTGGSWGFDLGLQPGETLADRYVMDVDGVPVYLGHGENHFIDHTAEFDGTVDLFFGVEEKNGVYLSSKIFLAWIGKVEFDYGRLGASVVDLHVEAAKYAGDPDCAVDVLATCQLASDASYWDSGTYSGLDQFSKCPPAVTKEPMGVLRVGEFRNGAMALPLAQRAPRSGGLITFDIQVPSGCTWAAQPMDSWIQVVGTSSGVGSGTLTVSVEPYLLPSALGRTGHIQIGDTEHTIFQNGSVPIQTQIKEVQIHQPCETGGILNFDVQANSFMDASASSPIFAIVRLGQNAILGESLVKNKYNPRSDRVFLSLRLVEAPEGDRLIAPANTVNIERWAEGESAVWLRINHSSLGWIRYADGTVGPPIPGTHRVEFDLGSSADESEALNQFLFDSGRANLPCNQREGKNVSTLLCLDLANSTLTDYQTDPVNGTLTYFINYYQQPCATYPFVFEDDTLPNNLTSYELAIHGDEALARGREEDICKIEILSASTPVDPAGQQSGNGLYAYPVNIAVGDVKLQVDGPGFFGTPEGFLPERMPNHFELKFDQAGLWFIIDNATSIWGWAFPLRLRRGERLNDRKVGTVDVSGFPEPLYRAVDRNTLSSPSQGLVGTMDFIADVSNRGGYYFGKKLFVQWVGDPPFYGVEGSVELKLNYEIGKYYLDPNEPVNISVQALSNLRGNIGDPPTLSVPDRRTMCSRTPILSEEVYQYGNWQPYVIDFIYREYLINVDGSTETNILLNEDDLFWILQSHEIWMNGFSPSAGNNTQIFTFNVDPNPNENFRVGYYQIKDEVVTVYQYGLSGCSPLVARLFPSWPHTSTVLNLVDDLACP